MKAETPNEKQPKATSSRKKITPPKEAVPTKEEIDQMVEQKVAEKLAEREAHPTVIVSTPVHTVEVQPAQEHIEPEHHSPIEEVEEKVVGLWGKVRSSKWFWFAVIGLSILIIFIVWISISNAIRNNQIKKSTELIERKQDTLQQITVQSDTSLLQLKMAEVVKLRRMDSSINATQHALDDIKKVVMYQLSLLSRVEEINLQTQSNREKINNPANTDDDVRRNAEGQLSKPIRQR